MNGTRKHTRQALLNGCMIECDYMARMRKGGILMALRSICLCDGKIIGIETIFTVINGMQINIPEKVEALRKKSRNNELFCPCGCGANLTLVAGDRNLREQHFRLKEGQSDKDCKFISEGSESIYSKIVLKCWLDDNYPGTDIEARVPICAVDDTNRRYEITLLARNRQLAISYCYNRANLSDEKLNILDENAAGIRIHYISDIQNTGMFLQYPEMMMKIQKRQGYCLFLELAYDSSQMVSYPKSKLKAIFYYRHNEGLWEELEIVSDLISSFSFSDNGDLLYSGTSLRALKGQCEQQYVKELEKRRLAWENEQAQRRIEQEQRQKESELRQQEYLAQQEKQKGIAAEAEKKRQERIEAERKAREEREKAIKECTKEKIDAVIDNDQDNPYYDPAGNRWVRCEYCGQIFTEGHFISHGGANHVNLGKCKDCNKKSGISVLPKYAMYAVSPITKTTPIATRQDPMICPECGNKLAKKNGRYGAFLGCCNYPRCKYTRKL